MDEVKEKQQILECSHHLKDFSCQSTLLIRCEEDIKDIENLKSNLVNQKVHYESKLTTLVHQKHLDSFRVIIDLFKSQQNLLTLLALLSVWRRYSQYLFKVYLHQSHNRNFLKSYKEKSTQSGVDS